jgi:hypothetical protein
MRTVLLSLGILALVGCSKAAGPAVESPTVSIPEALPAPPPVAAASQDAGPPAPLSSVHVIRLPDQPYDDLIPILDTIDAVRGEEPGPAFPAGTVYVATMDLKTDGALSVTEWDLERASVVKSLELPSDADDSKPWILRNGDRLRVALSGPEGVTYLQLTRDLRVERTERWTVYQDGLNGFSADEDLAAVAYTGSPPADPRTAYGVMVTTFDRSGRRLATRMVQRPATPDGLVVGLTKNLAVVDGRVFLLLSAESTGVELLKLRPDLRVEKRVRVSSKADPTMDLNTRGGRLQVDAGYYPERSSVEFSTNLERLGPTTTASDPLDFKLGDETVDVCIRKTTAWLAWSTTVADPCDASPSYLLNAPPAWKWP